ncbi:variable surface protein Vir22/23-related [Plasmodium vivax]|uniref:Variable surface protein Vir22/23-related n=1 Tax=Plasmodium vivax (strain Salvador I) TaxID=126793 RepID=A5KA31_PLAVS|nr:variable surface protein Vir22/23-related [Plasmodium vivax]EDL43919.1 variable surface protein Vir22/23-related [Plasmodium vivax]|eukprot:XP_001613646.1 variable surface protein Vir22/23-related [Plasmodium vivax Sal-1]
MAQNIVDQALSVLKEGNYTVRAATKLIFFYDIFDTDFDNFYKIKLCNGCDKNKYLFDSLRKTIKQIIEEWESLLDFFRCETAGDENTCCLNFIYWIYGKIKDSNLNVDYIKEIYNNLDEFVKQNCFGYDAEKPEKFFKKYVKAYDKKVLKRKKELYDFVQFYERVKSKLDAVHSKRKVMCDYISYIFKMYEEMRRDCSSIKSEWYEDEMKNFIEMLKKNNELTLLESKCGDITKGLILDDNIEALCPSNNESAASKKGQILKSPQEEEKFNLSAVPKVNMQSDVSNQLPSKKICEEMDKNNNPDLNITDCNVFKDQIGKSLCAHTIKNFKKINKIEDREQHNDYCLHFMYWLYGKIGENYINKSSNILEDPEISKFVHLIVSLNNKSSKYYCYYNSENNLEEWKEIIDLIDYFKIHNNIDNTKSCDDNACAKNCEYFSNISNLYKRHKRQCCTYFYYGDHFNNCTHYFKCDDKYSPDSMLTRLKCPVNENEKDINEEDEVVGFDQNVILQSLDSLKRFNQSKNICDGIMCDTFSKFAFLAFSFLGVLVTFFVFYKFTPLGIWLNRKGFKKNKARYDYYEESPQQLLENNSKPVQRNMQNGRIRIAYQS